MATKKFTRRRRKAPTKAEIEAMTREALRPSYRVICCYRGDPNRDLDDKIEKLARRKISGSGMWLMTGLRDLQFDFNGRGHSAFKAAARIKDARIRGVYVMIDSVERA